MRKEARERLARESLFTFSPSGKVKILDRALLELRRQQDEAGAD